MIRNLSGFENLTGFIHGVVNVVCARPCESFNVAVSPLCHIAPALSLFQGGAVSVHTALGRDTVTDLYWGQAGAMWQSGETATLKDSQGRAHTTFTTP